MKYKIFRLCRNDEKIKKLREEEKKYHLPKTEYKKDIDLYEFINGIIEKANVDYALICHDDVILPEGIDVNIVNAIKSMDSYVGDENWGVLGNAGLEVLTKRTLTYIADPHTKILPPKTERPKLVESLDGNTMLLNIKALRKKKVKLPEELTGFHLYDLILCFESYRKGLVCGVTSELYVKHLSSGNYKSFVLATQEKKFQKYFRRNYSNHQITTINGLIEINRNYKDLSKRAKKNISIEDTILKIVTEIFSNQVISLNILIRIHKETNKLFRLLDSVRILQSNIGGKDIKISVHLGINNISPEKIESFIEKIQKEYSDLRIKTVFVKKTKRYPRVEALRTLVKSLPKEENSYLWFVDYDDFVFPTMANYLQSILKDSKIVVGESVVFEEKWNDSNKKPTTSELKVHFEHTLAENIYSGETSVPICSVIYETEFAKKVMEKHELLGDYYEDYALLLLASLHEPIYSYPVLYAGISYHGENTVLETDRTHWDYSYASSISSIINKGLINQNIYNLILQNKRQNSQLEQEVAEFRGFKEGYLWKLLNQYRKVKKRILKGIRK